MASSANSGSTVGDIATRLATTARGPNKSCVYPLRSVDSQCAADQRLASPIEPAYNADMEREIGKLQAEMGATRGQIGDLKDAVREIRAAAKEEIRALQATLQQDRIDLSNKLDARIGKFEDLTRSTKTTIIVTAIATVLSLAGLAFSFLADQRAEMRNQLDRQWSEIKEIQKASQAQPASQ